MMYGVIRAYSGYLVDDELLCASSSGGFAYAFALQHIKNRGIVYSVRWSSNFRVGEWARASDESEIAAFRGSKYVESRKTYDGFNLYHSIKQDLDMGLPVLAIGLPCDIGAIKAYLKHDYSNLICVDLICHGPTLRRVSEDFLHSLENRFGSKIVDFSVRYKRDGQWTPPYMRVSFENGKNFMKKFYRTDYGIAFSIVSRPSCYECKFKGDNHRSDVTIGDYWGLKDDNKDEWNSHGVSVAFVRSLAGERLIKSVEGLCRIHETDCKYAMENNAMLNQRKQRHPKYESFLADYEKYGLHGAVIRRNSIAEWFHKGTMLVLRKLCYKHI